MKHFELWETDEFGFGLQSPIYRDWGSEPGKRDWEDSTATEEEWQDAYDFARNVRDDFQAKKLTDCIGYEWTIRRLEAYEAGNRTAGLRKNLWRSNWG